MSSTSDVTEGPKGWTPDVSPHGAAPGQASFEPRDQDPVLCSHCGRTASNGLTCQGICVADSGY